MPLFEKYLFIKRSTIPAAGKGLFTRQSIPRGSHIVEYKGKTITWQQVKEQAEFNGYVYYVNRNFVIDAKDHVKSFGRFANDANGLAKIKGVRNNCCYVIDGDKVFIKAIKNIDAGEELLVSYGKEYWEVVRHNKKHGYL